MNIYDDPRTVPLADLTTTSHKDFHRDVLGHYYVKDHLVYRVIGWREGDGPWIEEIFGRSATRTISYAAIDRTFHHHKKCAAPGCRAECDATSKTESVEWSGAQQSTDGRTLWVNGNDGMCIGRLSPQGIDVHASARAQEAGEHCLYCEPGLEPFAKAVTFPMYVRFVEKMKEHHKVEISRAVPIRITAPALVAR